MPFTIGYKRGDVVLVEFPHTSHLRGKRRPAVIVSSDTYNKTGDVIVAAITGTEGPESYRAHITHWQKAGLKEPSSVLNPFVWVP